MCRCTRGMTTCFLNRCSEKKCQLKEHSNKMTHKDIMLHSYLGHAQSSPAVSSAVDENQFRDPQPGNVKRARDLQHTALTQMCPSNPTPQGSVNSAARGGSKILRATGVEETKETRPLKCNVINIYVNSRKCGRMERVRWGPSTRKGSGHSSHL